MMTEKREPKFRASVSLRRFAVIAGRPDPEPRADPPTPPPDEGAAALAFERDLLDSITKFGEIFPQIEPRWYRLNPNDHSIEPIPNERFLEGAMQLGDRTLCQVAFDEIAGVRISTTFLGLDHRFEPGGPPLVFETMIFPPALEERYFERDQWRYSTWDDAEASHQALADGLRRLPPRYLRRAVHLWRRYLGGFVGRIRSSLRVVRQVWRRS